LILGLIIVFGFYVLYLGSAESNPEIIKKSPNFSQSRPNIIVILTDDVSVDMIDLLLENNMMPNLQKYVIDDGTTFSNSFVTSPLCCPSRATTLTGLYPHNHEILFNFPVFENVTKIVNGIEVEVMQKIAKGGFEDFNDSSTIATWLKKGGYHTGYIGKYLNGYYGPITYVPPGWNEWISVALNSDEMYDFGINYNGDIIKISGEYKTDYFANTSVDFIKNSELPFFLFVSTLVAHSTHDATECEINDGHGYRKSILVSPKYKDTLKNIQIPYKPSFNEKDVSDKNPKYKKMPLIKNIDCLESQFQDRTESVRSVDDLIGSIYNALVTNNHLKNTIIIFTSDNGYSFGEHRFYEKIVPYEESIRVPLFIRLPGIEKQTVDHLVINNDLAPTILEMAGLDPETSMDGLSLVPIMKNSSKNLRDDFLIEIYAGGGSFYHGIRSVESLYLEWTGKFNFTEYYDLKNDPFQLSNISDCTEEQCIKNLEKLGLRLDELKECGNGSC